MATQNQEELDQLFYELGKINALIERHSIRKEEIETLLKPQYLEGYKDPDMRHRERDEELSRLASKQIKVPSKSKGVKL